MSSTRLLWKALGTTEEMHATFVARGKYCRGRPMPLKMMWKFVFFTFVLATLREHAMNGRWCELQIHNACSLSEWLHIEHENKTTAIRAWKDTYMQRALHDKNNKDQ